MNTLRSTKRNRKVVSQYVFASPKGRSWWAEQGSNLRPRPCKGDSVTRSGASLARCCHPSLPLTASGAARNIGPVAAALGAGKQDHAMLQMDHLSPENPDLAHGFPKP